MLNWCLAPLFNTMLKVSLARVQQDVEKRGLAPNQHRINKMKIPVKVFNRQGQLVGPIDVPRVEKTDQEWQKLLTPEQFAIARAHGTERPFCGTLLDNKRTGVYSCVCCGLPLFASNAKFESGTGWPSFFQPIADENVATKADTSYGMRRVEILCARCGCHLGHVFPDGPPPTRQRHCVNSESLKFTDVDQLSSLADEAAT
jgi:methionine-R-sulfoxide reductase